MSTELRASNVSLSYRSQGLWRRGQSVTALEDVSLSVAAGGSIGLVGSSGSGKSTLLRTLLALEKPATGTAELDGSPIRPGSASSLRWYRRLVQYVPQNPAGSLDPRMTVHQLLLEPLKQLHGPGDHHSMVREALERVELEPGHLGRRPRDLSGGQNQRVAIARALVTSPRILLADEPVSGLDMPLRNTVLTVLDRLVSRDGLGLLFVSHDLSAVAQLCTRTVVLSAGRIVEQGVTAAVLARPQHPSTQELMASLARLPASGGKR
jgi:peptide/nickel transport system ATP-binding protein